MHPQALQVVSLMSDVALLATTLAQAQLRQQGGATAASSPEALCSAAGSQVAAWLAAVRSSVTASGILSEEAAAALLQHWDWQPCLQQAALQLAAQQQPTLQPQRSGGSGNGATSAELRRAMQRSVRQLADLIRRGGSSPALATA